MGAASRIYGREEGLSPVFSSTPIGWAVAWTFVNVLLSVTPGTVVAWEAHLTGFAAGLMMVGPFTRALGRA